MRLADLEKRKMLRVDEVAELFLVTDRTVRNWIRGGKLAFMRLSPNQIRVDAQSVRDFMQKNTRKITENHGKKRRQKR